MELAIRKGREAPVATGKRLAISPARRMVLELLHHARKVPSLPVAKDLRIDGLLTPRHDADLSWTAVFLKAYGLVAAQQPELRRAYIPYLWPHYYEHPESVAAVLVERELLGETAILAARIRVPEARSLADIDCLLRGFRNDPIEKVKYFRQTLRLGRLPGLLRRFVLWHSLYLSGYWRAKRLGTFMISSLGNLGVEQIHPLTFHASYLTYGPIGQAGDVTVKIVYDHRVMDGRTAARSLAALEDVLTGPILEELQSLAEQGRSSVCHEVGSVRPAAA